jgi:hypothetical protein
MKYLPVIAMATATLLGSAAHAGDVNVGMSIQFSQPGVFGRIDIGQYPQPQVVVAQPVIVAPPPAMPPPEPIYLWVPLEHRKHWERYCGEYRACGHPVYFVNHVWYRNNVMARREERRGEFREEDPHREHGRSEEAHDRRDERREGGGRDEHQHEHEKGRRHD